MIINKNSIFLSVFLLVIILDQASKYIIRQNLLLNTSQIQIFDNFFQIIYIKNPGIAFGMLSSPEKSPLKLIFLIGVSITALFIIFLYFRKLPSSDKISSLSLSLIAGGASGNLIDRIYFGEVIDFLDFHLYHKYHWPAFNIADSSISIGCLILIFTVFQNKKEGKCTPF
ncbi:MAG: signal peptidase II [Thermodesulfobacteriota bacterium]|nr:signal peptidase II [Thermodesulfobacteriota bacterium]